MFKIFIPLLILLPVSIFSQNSTTESTSTTKKNGLFDGKLTKEIYEFFFDDKKEDKIDKTSITKSEDKFNQYEGKRIKHIYIKQLEVFENPNEESKLKSFANRLHINTRKLIIRNNLLFREYDIVQSRIFAESEKTLNEQNYIRSAEIHINPIKGEVDFVDVYIFVRDVWSIAANVSIGSYWDRYTIGLTDKNWFGFGNTFKTQLLTDRNENPEIGTNNRYIIKNIDGSFIDALGDYEYFYDKQVLGGKLKREFKTSLKYAGEVSWYENEYFEQKDMLGDIEVDHNKSVEYDFWIGRSFFLYEPFF